MVPMSSRATVTLLDAEGNQYEFTDTIALCRCGRSSTKPFCDGTHETLTLKAQRALGTAVPLASAS
jgi:CDGSH-type Zn-finger protein